MLLVALSASVALFDFQFRPSLFWLLSVSSSYKQAGVLDVIPLSRPSPHADVPRSPRSTTRRRIEFMIPLSALLLPFHGLILLAVPRLGALAAAAAPATIRASCGAAAVSLAWRRAHEGEVDLDGLVEQLGLVGAFYGGACLGKGCVLDKCVALTSISSGIPVLRVSPRRKGEDGG